MDGDYMSFIDYQQMKLLWIAFLCCWFNVSNCSCFNCTANTTNAFCSGGQFCACYTGFVFNCNTYASPFPANWRQYLVPFKTTEPNYFQLESQMGPLLLYRISFYDSKNPDIKDSYDISLLADRGMYEGAQNVTKFTSSQSLPYNYTFTIALRIEQMAQTTLPQKLILSITLKNPLKATALMLFYTYSSEVGNTGSILLIIGYVAGGLLVLISVIMILLVYRRRGRRTRSSLKKQQEFLDLSYFAELLPQQIISIQDRKELQVCSVCLQEFDFNSTVRKIPCSHVFHSLCLDQWAVKNLTCPFCRAELTKDNLIKMRAQILKKENESDWIVNSLAEEQISEVRQPLQQELIRNQAL